jgi:hypothetical protein
MWPKPGTEYEKWEDKLGREKREPVSAHVHGHGILDKKGCEAAELHVYWYREGGTQIATCPVQHATSEAVLLRTREGTTPRRS